MNGHPAPFPNSRRLVSSSHPHRVNLDTEYGQIWSIIYRHNVMHLDRREWYSTVQAPSTRWGEEKAPYFRFRVIDLSRENPEDLLVMIYHY